MLVGDALRLRNVGAAFMEAQKSAPGLYARANLLIQPFLSGYRRVIIILGVEWDGSPGKSAIVEKIGRRESPSS